MLLKIGSDASINKMMQIAYYAHFNQKRKWNKEPYFVHPVRTRYIIEETFGGFLDRSTGIIEASVGHDLIEDTEMTAESLGQMFDPKIVKLVEELTNPSAFVPEETPRVEKRAMDYAHIRQISDIAKTIKLADRLDNLRDIQSTNYKYAMKYLAESDELAKICYASCPVLGERLVKLIVDKIATLEKMKKFWENDRRSNVS